MKTLLTMLLLATSVLAENEVCQNSGVRGSYEFCVQRNLLSMEMLEKLGIPIPAGREGWSILQVFVRTQDPRTELFKVTISKTTPFTPDLANKIQHAALRVTRDWKYVERNRETALDGRNFQSGVGFWIAPNETLDTASTIIEELSVSRNHGGYTNPNLWSGPIEGFIVQDDSAQWTPPVFKELTTKPPAGLDGCYRFEAGLFTGKRCSK